MAVQRKQFQFDEDKFIITNLILSTPLCREVLKAANQDYFKSKGVKVILGWMKEHYSKYGECLGTKINEYYEINAETIDPAVKDQIYNILEHLTEIRDTEVHNIPYLKDRALTLFRKKFYDLQIKAANAFMEKGDIANAEKALAQRFGNDDVQTTAISLGDPGLLLNSIHLIFREEDADPFFKMEGSLGDFLGELEAGWLTAFIAPPKTGKTVMLMETIITAIMQRRNVVFFSLEMPLRQITARILKRITGLANPEGSEYFVPVFDCRHNQDGSCALPQRLGYGDILDHEAGPDALMPFDPEIEWVTCTECRGTKEFSPVSWKVSVKKNPITETQFKKQVDGFMRLYAKYCRAIFYPSKTMDADIMNDEIDALISRENFIPDIIVIDYADLMKPSGGNGQKRLELDNIWESLRSTGQSRAALIVTASQTSKNAVDAMYIRQQDIAEDFSKIAKLDLGIGLAQPEVLKNAGILNANIVAHRHKGFIVSKVCTILQDSEAMQGHLDSAY